MDRVNLKSYLASVPERVLRSATAIAAGTLRELGELTLPGRLRRTRLYNVLVESTLRFLIEQVGQVQGAYPESGEEVKDFVMRRTAGNILEIAGILAFRASPVWVLAALADLSGAGRDLVADIAESLKKEGLLEGEGRFETVEQLLDGLESVGGRLAQNVNSPPLDVATLRQEWRKLQDEARKLPFDSLPAPTTLWAQWNDLKDAAREQDRPVFEVASTMAVAAIRRLPENLRWLSRAAQVSAKRTGQVMAQGLLDDYRKTLAAMREAGFLAYWGREFRPYLDGALRQFSTERESWTERLLRRYRR